jgi:hypothetical protein
MALANARALHDPLVRCVDLRLKVGIGDDLLGQVGANAEDNGSQGILS